MMKWLTVLLLLTCLPVMVESDVGDDIWELVLRPIAVLLREWVKQMLGEFVGNMLKTAATEVVFEQLGSLAVYHAYDDPAKSNDCAQKTFSVQKVSIVDSDTGAVLNGPAFPPKIAENWVLGSCPGAPWTFKYFHGNCPSLKIPATSSTSATTSEVGGLCGWHRPL
eukprot:TRINITY_DN17422_c0_g1_i1.p2 TRINITY_DN17422_c0_g1~~TRINITY_DN17422_c0_g1_i1.p2  ORF type:complete len:166 (-),score=10.91 TRINITY_DN17422_c0_g1_i1:248-745(-)